MGGQSPATDNTDGLLWHDLYRISKEFVGPDSDCLRSVLHGAIFICSVCSCCFVSSKRRPSAYPYTHIIPTPSFTLLCLLVSASSALALESSLLLVCCPSAHVCFICSCFGVRPDARLLSVCSSLLDLLLLGSQACCSSAVCLLMSASSALAWESSLLSVYCLSAHVCSVYNQPDRQCDKLHAHAADNVTAQF